MKQYAGGDMQEHLMQTKSLRLCFWGYAGSSFAGVPEHTHDYWQAQVALEGVCRITAGGREYLLTPYTLLFIPPETKHSLQYEEPCRLATYKFYYDGAVPEHPVFAADDQFARGVVDASMAILKSTFPAKYFDLDEGAVIMPHDTYQLCMEYYLAGVLTSLLRTPVPRSRVLDEIYAALAAHSQTFTVAEAAECCGYSRNYFCMLIKQAAGITAREFMNRLRVECANRYLRYSGKTLAEIAGITGFSSQFHFSEFFKRETGCSPSHYRKNNR